MEYHHFWQKHLTKASFFPAAPPAEISQPPQSLHRRTRCSVLRRRKRDPPWRHHPSHHGTGTQPLSRFGIWVLRKICKMPGWLSWDFGVSYIFWRCIYIYIVSVWVYLGVLYRKHGVKLLSYPPPQKKNWRGINPRGFRFFWRV